MNDNNSAVEIVELKLGDTFLFVETGEYEGTLQEQSNTYEQLRETIKNKYMSSSMGVSFAYVPKGLRLVVVRNDY